MIIHNLPLTLRVNHNPLSTGCIHIAMTRQDSRAAIVRQATGVIGIDVRTGNGVGATHNDVIFVAGRYEIA
jgi:hypothetical protein